MCRFQARKWTTPHRGVVKKTFARPLHRGGENQGDSLSLASLDSSLKEGAEEMIHRCGAEVRGRMTPSVASGDTSLREGGKKMMFCGDEETSKGNCYKV